MDLYFTELVIVQSLPPNEPATGKQLQDYLTSAHALQIPVRFVDAPTSAHLFHAIAECRQRTIGTNYIPIIHLEIHGVEAQTGLVMASGEFLNWKKVASHLRELNIAVRNSLIIVLGVCSGAFVATAAATSPFEPAPFRGVIGPDKKVSSFFLPYGFGAFYSKLVETGDFAQSLTELRQRSLPEYIAMDTAAMFRKGLQSYEREFLRGDVLAKRVKKILRHAPTTEIVKMGGRNKARSSIARRIRDTAERRQELYRHFIMADVFPENLGRLLPLD